MLRSTILLAAALHLPIASGQPYILPNAELTPGATRTTTVELICQKGSSKNARDVSEKVKRQVYARYNMAPNQGACAPAGCEVDHLISLELGGSNALENLWPQPYGGTPYNAHAKDKLENRLHALVCSGQMTLEEAQTAISRDWINTYRKVVGEFEGETK